MMLTVAAWDDRVFPVELDAAASLATLSAILEAESGLPAARQQLLHNGRALPQGPGERPLSELGVADGDVLLLMPAQQQQQGVAAGAAGVQQGQQGQPQPPPQQQSDPVMELLPDGSARSPAAFIQAVKGRPGMLDMIGGGNPALAAAIRAEDVPAMQEELRHVRKAQREREAAQAAQAALADADPFDPEVQRKIEEMIQQQNIQENLEAALEHNPEVFGSVEMLYVDMEVNGVPVKAFVDSGAQMTIMTSEFASKCYLTRLLDKRFAGLAVGVGSSRILGRIHQAPLKVAGHFTTCSITVLEQRDGPQFIFGLDMLKRHLCVLDMAQGELRFGSCDATLQFLPEHQIPKDFKRHIEEVSQQQAEKNVDEAARAESAGGAGPSAGGDAAPMPMDAAPTPPAAATAVTTPAAMPPPAAAPAAAAAAPAAAPAVATPAAVSEAAVAQLVGLGFPQDIAVGALQATGGDVDAAASMLFGM